MKSRSRWSVIVGAASCMVLAGTCWVSGQQGRYRETYQPKEAYQSAPAPQPMSSLENRGETRVDACDTAPGPVGYRSYGNGRVVMSGRGYSTPGYSTPGYSTPGYSTLNSSEAPEPQPYQSGNGSSMLGQRSSAMIGTTVKLSDGQVVGRLDDLVISDTGCVDYMIVSFNNAPEYAGRLAAIPWTAGEMDFRARSLTLDIDRDRLRQAPIFFSRGRGFPNFYEPQWAANVHTFFGIESDIDRRIERAHRAPEPRDSDPANRGGNRRDTLQSDRLQSKPQLAPRPEPGEPSSDLKRNRSYQEGQAAPDQGAARRGEDAGRRQTDPFEKDAKQKKTDVEPDPAPAPAERPEKKERDETPLQQPQPE